MTWAWRLKRVFDIDIQTREACGDPVLIIAAIEDPAVIKKILDHLDRQGALPLAYHRQGYAPHPHSLFRLCIDASAPLTRTTAGSRSCWRSISGLPAALRVQFLPYRAPAARRRAQTGSAIGETPPHIAQNLTRTMIGYSGKSVCSSWIQESSTTRFEKLAISSAMAFSGVLQSNVFADGRSEAGRCRRARSG